MASATKYAAPDLTNELAAMTLIRPKAYANSSVNTEYNPQISALVRALLTQQQGVKNNQKDITNWYGHVTDMYKQAAADDSAYGASAVSGLNDSISGLVGQLGGAAGRHVGSLGAILASQQVGMNRNDNHFLTEMRPITALQGADAHTREQRLGQDYGALLAGKLADTRAAKGSARTKALQDALQLRDQEAAAKIAAAGTVALLPGQIDAQGVAVDTAKDALTRAQQLAPLQLAQAKAQLAAAQTKGGWNLKDPSQVAALSRALRTSMGLGASGGYQYDPSAAYQNELSAIEQAGLSNNPTAIKLAQSIAAQAINTTHAHRQWGQYYVAPDGSIKLDRSRPRYDGKPSMPKTLFGP